jgi:hypothetical protein
MSSGVSLLKSAPVHVQVFVPLVASDGKMQAWGFPCSDVSGVSINCILWQRFGHQERGRRQIAIGVAEAGAGVQNLARPATGEVQTRPVLG